jgi:hypothetical protein
MPLVHTLFPRLAGAAMFSFGVFLSSWVLMP